MTEGEEYLGDGLYVSWNGWQFILRAPRPNGDHWVALEPEMVHDFNRYVEKTYERLGKK